MTIYSFRAALRNSCNPKNKRKFTEFLAIGECANKPDSRKVIYAGISKFLETVDIAKDLKPAKLGVGHLCCDYYKALADIESKLEKTCDPATTQTVIEFVKNIFQAIINMGCTRYSDDTDACSKLSPLTKTSSNEKKKFNSFLFRLTEFWDLVQRNTN